MAEEKYLVSTLMNNSEEIFQVSPWVLKAVMKMNNKTAEDMMTKKQMSRLVKVFMESEVS